MQCIACQREMTDRCECGAAWLADDKLVEMAQEMKGSLVALPWKAREGEQRPCPQCGAAMLAVSLDGVALDRCDGHGVWFDAHELEAVLQRAVSFPDPRGSKGPKLPHRPFFDDAISRSPDHHAEDATWAIVGGLRFLLGLVR